MIRHLFISPGHSYFGRHGQPAEGIPMTEVSEIECLAGRGIRGDRFLDYKPDYKGQITFYAWEDLTRMWADLGVPMDGRDPSATRRNVISEGLNLSELIGKEFEIQGVRFLGNEECRPCYWMNGAIHPEAEAWMRGRGGLRAKIRSDGWLKRDESECKNRTLAALLAGGRSTRMGQDKAALEFGGVPLWQRQIDLLSSTCDPVAVFASVRPPWLPDKALFVQDSPVGQGPMAGLLAALEWTLAQGGSHVLVLAVDLPRIKPQLLRQLAGACRSGQGRIPANEAFFEPLCAVYPVEALPVLLESAQHGHWKLQDAIKDLLAKGLMVSQSLLPEERDMLFNLNSPEDLAVLKAP